ncbi:GDP-mannose 4,6-dehydratase [Oscillochloris sp. ZM17-4]|uniref:GDP-mannose 4,6-dehydratase n=1 Tax=Oscillochloris sp. ZM17-4 TaxID=2866714 RepID=UPI001C73124C|nr:GDP-mannose 4,6-dehydratase [Oscillochloris sp. ZM17-4]MBX0327306.1 GDP-mannose 4,6-dehydratase [Oscillochloris sp. ZM17-4]
MRALITGINGFVGSHLAEHLLQQSGWEIWGLSRSPTIALASLQGRVTLLQASLSDPQSTSEAIIVAQPDVIFHLAGQPFVPESFRDPAATLAANTLGALHIFLALIAQRMGTRVLVVGTNEEYGQIHAEDLPVREDAPLRPTSPYGVSKVAQSMLALQYHLSHRLDIVRVRPFTHIGPRQNERFVTAAFARQIARIELGLQPASMQVGNLSACRDFTDVRDIVRAYALLAQHGEAGEVYNVGSGQAVMIRDLLDTLLAESTAVIEIRPDPSLMRPIDVPLIVCDAGKIRARTGWEPSIPIVQTLRDILAYWRQAERTM